MLKAATETEYISDHNDFGKNQRFDHSHPVIRVRDIMGSQNESPVLRKRGEHEREICNIYPVLGKLMDYLLLQIPFLLIRDCS